MNHRRGAAMSDERKLRSLAWLYPSRAGAAARSSRHRCRSVTNPAATTRLELARDDRRLRSASGRRHPNDTVIGGVVVDASQGNEHAGLTGTRQRLEYRHSSTIGCQRSGCRQLLAGEGGRRVR